jgi:hypothetical protein
MPSPLPWVEAALYQWKQRLRDRARGTIAPADMADLIATVTALVESAEQRAEMAEALLVNTREEFMRHMEQWNVMRARLQQAEAREKKLTPHTTEKE